MSIRRIRPAAARQLSKTWRQWLLSVKLSRMPLAPPRKRRVRHTPVWRQAAPALSRTRFVLLAVSIVILSALLAAAAIWLIVTAIEMAM